MKTLKSIYLYTKPICFSGFVLFSLTVNSFCMANALKSPLPCVPTSRKSFLSLIQPVLPPSSAPQSRPVFYQSAWPLLRLCLAFILAPFYSQEECIVTSPRSIPLQKVILHGCYWQPSYTKMRVSLKQCLGDPGEQYWSPKASTHKVYLAWNFENYG